MNTAAIHTVNTYSGICGRSTNACIYVHGWNMCVCFWWVQITLEHLWVWLLEIEWSAWEQSDPYVYMASHPIFGNGGNRLGGSLHAWFKARYVSVNFLLLCSRVKQEEQRFGKKKSRWKEELRMETVELADQAKAVRCSARTLPAAYIYRIQSHTTGGEPTNEEHHIHGTQTQIIDHIQPPRSQNSRNKKK